MVEEIIILQVKEGRETEFIEAVKQVKGIMEAAKGYGGSELRRCVEEPNRFMINITWETMDNHLVDFKESAGFTEMKEILAPFYLYRPVGKHYEKISI